ncbi:MAG TPA: hypothetical protein VFS13_08045 [Steroidobacteraceae bacterium]|nr:hypothetical protein [Steroidobacteraceae bacterium]
MMSIDPARFTAILDREMVRWADLLDRLAPNDGPVLDRDAMNARAVMADATQPIWRES